jgi:hypothetical protein
MIRRTGRRLLRVRVALFQGGAAPNIISHPTDRTIVAFQPATFAVTATGAALNYQWRRNGNNITTATNSTLLITNVQPVNFGTYDVVVFNAAGSATSSNATLNIAIPPTITLPPQNRTVLAGESATFTVAASGTGTLTVSMALQGHKRQRRDWHPPSPCRT